MTRIFAAETPWRHVSFPVVLAALSFCAQAQNRQCDNGIVYLPENINATVTICSAIAARVPALSRQLSEIQKAQGDQQNQLKELKRLVTGLNSVSQNIGLERQAVLLNNLSSKLAESQKAGNEQVLRQVSNLADGLDDLKDQLVKLLMNKATAEKTTDAVDGPVGDAIAKLDLATAHTLLADILAQLKAIRSEVGEVNQRTIDIKKTLDEQRREIPSISSALASVDVESLKALTTAGIQPRVIEEAFRQKPGNGKTTTAQRFFENSINSREAIDWLDSALAAGVDPNMTVPNDYYEREGILNQAMRAGNAQAVKALLHRGASPHAFQDLFLTRFPEPRFLYPLQTIADDDRFNLAEKQDLAKAFIEAGVVIPDPAPVGKRGKIPAGYEAKKIQDKIAPELGMRLPPSPLCCGQAGPICKQASLRAGDDWCAILSKMPKNLAVAFPEASFSPIWDISVQYLLNIEGNKIHFLGLSGLNAKYSTTPVQYVLVEVSKDASSWTVLSFMSPQAAMGLCKKDDKDDDGPRADWCWRRIPLHRLAGTDQVRSDLFGLTWKITNEP